MLHRIMRRRDSRSETIWLTVYADLITNLALVFLALYGLTIMGDKALEEALQSMKFTHIEDIPTTPGNNLKFHDIAAVLDQEFKDTPDVTISAAAGMARIELGEQLLFESGSAVTKPGAVPVLEKIATLLQIVPYTVVVEGHTDNLPLRAGTPYRDNRELSLARSMAIVRMLIQKGGLNADQLAAAAYGEVHPRASNLTPDGRRLNRRVEIVFVKDFPYTPGKGGGL